MAARNTPTRLPYRVARWTNRFEVLAEFAVLDTAFPLIGIMALWLGIMRLAERAGLVKPNSNWLKIPTDMLVARAQSRLCRMVYPDLLAGLYTPDELGEIRLVATTVAA